jgi:hypothetical protein
MDASVISGLAALENQEPPRRKQGGSLCGCLQLAIFSFSEVYAGVMTPLRLVGTTFIPENGGAQGTERRRRQGAGPRGRLKEVAMTEHIKSELSGGVLTLR